MKRKLLQRVTRLEPQIRRCAMKWIPSVFVAGSFALAAASSAQTNRVDEPANEPRKEPTQASVTEPSKWFCEFDLYMLAAGMSGDLGIGPFNANLNVPFHEILDHLSFGAMGLARVGYDRWSVSTDVIYVSLDASQNGVSASMNQWLVEPALEYRVCRGFTPYVGARYNNVNAELSSNGPLGMFREISGTVSWTDPVIGCFLSMPIYKTLSIAVRGDVGGFGINSKLAWQAEPVIYWQASKVLSVYTGYRWIASDYSTGSGLNRFKYDITIQGIELGVALRF